MPVFKLNKVECALQAKVPLAAFPVAIKRVLSVLEKDIFEKNRVLMFLPAVGTIVCLNRILSVKFLDYLSK